MTKRLTREELEYRINNLWEQFHVRPEMANVTYEEFKKECIEEYNKQQQMTDKQLDKYRKDVYNTLVNEANSLSTKEELEKLNTEDSKTITVQDELKFQSQR